MNLITNSPKCRNYVHPVMLCSAVDMTDTHMVLDDIIASEQWAARGRYIKCSTPARSVSVINAMDRHTDTTTLWGKY